MRPGMSVVFLTTLIGAGQGLFLALYAAEVAALLQLVAAPGPGFFVAGAGLAFVFTAAGAVASLFHLGHPERAWRAMAMWRTSWLSREGIAVLGFMALLAGWGAAHALGLAGTALLGALAALASLSLFVCTAMIYACIRFLQEWASPLTVTNYIVLGCASGMTLASGFAAFAAPSLAPAYAWAAVGLTTLGWATRSASLRRNARLRPKSTLRSATGIHHPRIVQTSAGFMGGSYNTREFFHGRTPAALRTVRRGFLLLAFVVPLVLLAVGLGRASGAALVTAFLVQYVGLLAERWYFFAQANHPQNIYYQAIS